MSAPTSSATIEFPESALQDEDVRKLLEQEGVQFNHKPFDPNFTLDAEGDIEITIENEVFSLSNPEARYGEFEDLEALLIQKGIPFDRDSGMDWNRPPEVRVFRPGDPPIDKVLCDDPDFCALVNYLRETIKAHPEGKGVQEIMAHLDEVAPIIPPLWTVKHEEPA